MIIRHATLPNGQKADISISSGKIDGVFQSGRFSKGEIDAEGMYVIPGLVDIHTHGCHGADTMDADLPSLCRYYAAHGTTSFLATTMTMPPEDIQRVTDQPLPSDGAEVLGFHLEGPFISAKYKGAQKGSHIRAASLEEFSAYRNVKMITLAPETENALPFIRAVRDKCIVSIGHTDCDYDTALAAMKAGANCLTHIYNAMPPLHHRAPGPIGAAIESNAYAQLICDGVHVAKPVVLSAYRTFGADRLVLISDSIRPAGMPDGEYVCGDLPVILKNGIARLKDGTIAGSGSTLWDCVKTALSFGIPFADAVKTATETPANLIGVNKGRIEKGYDADLLLVDPSLNIRTVIIGGKIYTESDMRSDI